MNGIVPQANGESSKVKVKVRVNISGLFSVSGATITEKVENAPSADEQEPMDVDNSAEKTPDDAAGTEASDKQQQEQSTVAEGAGDSPKESSSVNDIGDVGPATNDAETADKV